MRRAIRLCCDSKLFNACHLYQSRQAAGNRHFFLNQSIVYRQNGHTNEDGGMCVQYAVSPVTKGTARQALTTSGAGRFARDQGWLHRNFLPRRMRALDASQ
jgi:hypothetical protein